VGPRVGLDTAVKRKTSARENIWIYKRQHVREIDIRLNTVATWSKVRMVWTARTLISWIRIPLEA